MPTVIPTLTFSVTGDQEIYSNATLTNPATSNYSGAPYGVINYASSNHSVAVVSSSGVVTAVGPGLATILARQVAITGVNTQVSLSYTLTVVPVPVPVLTFDNPNPSSIKIGQQFTNAATSTIPGAITYTTFDSSIAVVNGIGLVTAVGSGTVIITATEAAVPGVNAQATATYSLTVDPVPTPVLTFDKTSATIILGDIFASRAVSTLTGGNYGLISYASSNPSIQIDTGTGAIVLQAIGQTTITATQAAVKGYNTQATATYSLTINPVPPLPIPVLTFAKSSAGIAIGSLFDNVARSTLSGGSYGAITYTSDNNNIATVDSVTGIVTGVANGTTTITATQLAVTRVNQTATTTYSILVFPAANTLLSTYCSGYDQYGQYADGNNGTYNQLIETNSAHCGYVQPAVPNLGRGIYTKKNNQWVLVNQPAVNQSNSWTNVKAGFVNQNGIWKQFYPYNVTAKILVVAGGGGGGIGYGYEGGGGGGAGGVVYQENIVLSVAVGSSYTAVVGAGGGANNSGSFSSFTGLTLAIGGGNGGWGASNNTAGSGGSGGGGCGYVTTHSGGSGTTKQGNAGGTGIWQGFGQAGGGGGGGYSGAGNGSDGNAGGHGGNGIQLLGFSVAGGGGGGYGSQGSGGSGAGGDGGGGGGGAGNGGNALDNTGGGGGGGLHGGQTSGGQGASGIVVVQYPGTQAVFTGGTITVNNSVVTHAFTTTGVLTGI